MRELRRVLEVVDVSSSPSSRPSPLSSWLLSSPVSPVSWSSAVEVDEVEVDVRFLLDVVLVLVEEDVVRFRDEVEVVVDDVVGLNMQYFLGVAPGVAWPRRGVTVMQSSEEDCRFLVGCIIDATSSLLVRRGVVVERELRDGKSGRLDDERRVEVDVERREDDDDEELPLSSMLLMLLKLLLLPDPWRLDDEDATALPPNPLLPPPLESLEPLLLSPLG